MSRLISTPHWTMLPLFVCLSEYLKHCLQDLRKKKTSFLTIGPYYDPSKRFPLCNSWQWLEGILHSNKSFYGVNKISVISFLTFIIIFIVWQNKSNVHWSKKKNRPRKCKLGAIVNNRFLKKKNPHKQILMNINKSTVFAQYKTT